MATGMDTEHYLTVVPRWSVGSHDSYSSLNDKLSDLVADSALAKKPQLLATTLTEEVGLAGTPEATNAFASSVTLIGCRRSLGCEERPSDAWLNFTPHCFFRDLPQAVPFPEVIIAHAPDFVWGALNIQQAFYPNSKIVLFNHSCPANPSRAVKQNICQWAARASVVISLDAETYGQYEEIYQGAQQTEVKHKLVEIADLSLDLLTSNNHQVLPPSPRVSPPVSPNGTGGGKSPINAVTAGMAGLDFGPPKKIEWHNKITPKLREFHDAHARHPDEAVRRAMPFFEGTMKQIEGKLRDKNFCVRFEYTGSAYEKVMINPNDIEFDVMVVMADGTELKDELFDTETGGFFLLKPSDEDSQDKYAKLLHSPEQQVLSPEKVVNSFFGNLQKAVNDIGVGNKVKLRKHGPAIQMDVYHDTTKTLKEFSVDIVPSYQIRCPGVTKLFVAKPYEKGTGNLSWRRSFSAEEKKEFKGIDDGDGCRRMCVRIIKAIRKPPQSVKRKADSSFSHITSFMIKNALFYENRKGLRWGMEKLGPRTIGLISSMAAYVENGFFPHFFLPRVNILAGMEAGPRNNLAKRLQRLVSSEVEFCRVIGAE